MNRPTQRLLLASAACLFALAPLLATPALAEPAAAPAGAKAAGAKAGDAKPAAKPAKITVAVLEFEGKDPANPDLGKNVADIINAVLGTEDSITLVDRTQLEKTLQEQSVNLTGLVDAEQATKVGRLVGARIIITGKCFMVGQQTFLTAKVIGVETSLVKPVLVKGPAKEVKLDELAVQLADDVAKVLHTDAATLVAPDAATDPLPALVDTLSTRQRPKVAVILSENHIALTHAVDPAAETEIKILLQKAGFEIQDVDENDLASWAKNMDANDISAWPKSLAHVEMVVTGKGFSEVGAHIGSLVSCTARVEINVISRKDGKVVLADRTTTRDVDLSENIAAKKALEKAGHTLGINILTYFAKSLPAAEAGKAPAAKPQAAP